MKKSKKLVPLYIMDYLQRYTDEDHPMLINQIVDKLEEMEEYDLDVERKSVSRNIKMLIDEGIVESYGGKRGCYFSDRQFEPSELRFLIHSILWNTAIPTSQSNDLIKRFMDMGGIYFDPGVEAISVLGDGYKSENKEFFLNIDEITQAIRSGSKIGFEYHRYGVDKKLHKASEHVVSPYQILMKNQTYYLLGYSETYKDVTSFRLDHIKGIKVLGEAKVPLKSIPGYEKGIDYKYLSGGLPYMFSDKPESVVFKADSSMVDTVVSRFGKDVIISGEKKSAAKKGENSGEKEVLTFAVTTSPTAMTYWALQYLDKIEVVSPNVRERIKATLDGAAKKYSDSKEGKGGK